MSASTHAATQGRAELAVELCREEVLRYLGYPEGRAPAPPLAGLVDETLAEARALVEPCGVWQRLPVARAAELGLPPTPAAGFVLALATIGARLSARATECLEQGEVTHALVLDAAGSAAAEEAADRLSAVALGGAAGATAAERVSCRVSPGYGRWPLEAQADVFRLLPHAAIGVELLPTLLMVPRKSVSFAIWLGADGLPLAGWSGCDHCLLERCLFRRRPAGAGGVQSSPAHAGGADTEGA